MTLFDDMKAALALVPAALGVTWEYRIRSSQRGDTPAFGAWIELPVLGLEALKSSTEVEGGDELTDSIMARVSHAAVFGVGDQLKNGAIIYHVAEQVSSGTGTKRFLCETAQRSLFGDLRGGGY